VASATGSLPTTIEPTLDREVAAWSEARLLIGVDEVGRGPLAGPVVAAAIVFPAHTRAVAGVRDSKTLSALQRASLVPELRGRAAGIGLGAASPREIDRLNIRVATALAMRRAINRVWRLLSIRDPLETTCRILIDGLPLPELGLPHQALVDGDALCYSIAAAGVIAKEIRDDLMHRLGRLHPRYGWGTNVGYATSEHCAALAAFGPSPHHRRSFAPVVQIPLFGS